jgi:hypothetical protein
VPHLRLWCPGLRAVVVRYRYVVVVLTYLVTCILGDNHEGDLAFFGFGRRLLFDGTGLTLYAHHPEIQIGPIALLAGTVLDVVSFGQLDIGAVVAALCMLVVLARTVESLAREAGAAADDVGICIAAGGSLTAVSWEIVVPGWGHLDDLAAILALVACIRALRADRAIQAGALMAIAGGCKPWALFAAAALFVLPGRVSRTRAIAAFVLHVGACWLPFLVEAPETVERLSAFQIQASIGSLPHALGYGQAPRWIRSAQLISASVSIGFCVRSRRCDLVLLCMAVCRLVLDGGTYPYYGALLVVACWVCDAVAAAERRRSAWLIPTTTLALLGSTVLPDLVSGRTGLVLRLLLYGALVAVAVPGTRRTRDPVPIGSVAEVRNTSGRYRCLTDPSAWRSTRARERPTQTPRHLRAMKEKSWTETPPRPRAEERMVLFRRDSLGRR